MWRKPACQNLSKFLDTSSATTWVVSRPTKSPSNSIRYNCHMICTWMRRPETIIKILKGHTSRSDQPAYCLQVFQRFW